MAGQGSILRPPRFKGIENFLRKIAFNLGNTPSQTEVKIISCIPIDVTDLQNKIVDLERELDERDRDRVGSSDEEPRNRRGSTSARAAVGAPVFTPAQPPLNPTSDVTETAKPVASPPSLRAEPSSRSLSVIDSTPTRMPRSSTAISIDGGQEARLASFINGREGTKKKRRMPKLRMMDKNKKGKSQMVYYTQMIYPKKVKEEVAHRSKRRPSDEKLLSHTHLANVMERQYRPKPINCEPSTSSGFSWPVCRDEPAGSNQPLHFDSDVCSCCHGLFHNVDTTNDADLPTGNQQDYSIYYDSSLYDVVPVKETPLRNMKKNDNCQHRPDDIYVDMEKACLSNKPIQPRVQFEQQLNSVCCTVNTSFRNDPKQKCKKKVTNKSTLKKEQVLRAMQKRKHDDNLRIAELSYSGYVDCGEVYAKVKSVHPDMIVPPRSPLQINVHPDMIVPPRAPPQINPPQLVSQRPILKNAECLTISFNDQETQPLISRSVQLEPPPAPPPPPSPPSAPPDNKTEVTLNQIKSILHAVLTEVKTSAQKTITVEDKPTKDAVVQNGPSQSNIATNSSYMNSYLYSPRYSFCPYGPSFSGQAVAGSQRLYPPGSGVPPQCLFTQDSKTTPQASYGPPGPSPCAAATKLVQNYPLFIHTTGRQCTCCYRSVPTQPNLPPTCPPPAIIPVKNEVNRNESRNQETNNLIKEIYKSLALNMNYPQKDTSSNYTDLRSSVNASNKKFEFKIEPKNKPKVVASEILHKGENSMFVSKALRQQFGTTEASFRSEIKTGTTVSTAETESASPRGDGVRSLLSAKKELLSTGSETAHERERSSPTARNRNYSPPAPRDHTYSEEHDRDYSPSQRHERDYSHTDRHERSYSPSDHRDRGYTPSTRNRRYSPEDKRDRRYPAREDHHHDSTPQTLTGSISDEDTPTPSIDNSEDSDVTVIDVESLPKKEKKGIFSKMKNLFTTRRRRRRKEEDHSSDMAQEPSSDSDDYETVYSEVTNRSAKPTKQERVPTPPSPASRRRRPHSKVSFSRYHRHEASTPRSPRHRHESPVIAPRPRRSPYMEQEYRRRWTEELAFHQGDTPRYSSERPRTRGRREFDFAKYTSPPVSPYNPYWREYEARSVRVPPPRAPMPVRPPGNVQQSYQQYTRPGVFQQPYYSPYNAAQDQISKGGQTEQAPKSIFIPQDQKHLYVPQSYQGVPKAKGFSWLKKLNTNCGVQWKHFFLEG